MGRKPFSSIMREGKFEKGNKIIVIDPAAALLWRGVLGHYYYRNW